MGGLIQTVLVTGASGMVGSYVDFGIKKSRADLDVTDPAAVAAAIETHRPTWVIHLAAETDVDRCEREPARAYGANLVGTFNLAQICRDKGIAMLYLSTDGVFDGAKEAYSENDTPNSQSVYGRSKWLGEVMVRDCVPNHVIVRAGWMFGGGPSKDRKFVAKVLKQLPAKEIRAVVDQRGSAIYAKDLVAVIKKLLSGDERGLFHVCNAGDCSRHELAEEIMRLASPETMVTPVDSTFFNLAAKRYTAPLKSVRLQPLRPWREALKEYLLGEWGTVIARSNR